MSYSPALHCSTIGAGGLNFSVRNGKRWDPAAITTWISLRSNEKWVMRSEKLEIKNEKWERENKKGERRNVIIVVIANQAIYSSTKQSTCPLVYLSTCLLVNLTISAHLHRQRNLLMIRVFEDVQMVCRLVRVVFRVWYAKGVWITCWLAISLASLHWRVCYSSLMIMLL